MPLSPRTPGSSLGVPPCHDCGAQPGLAHGRYFDVARCLATGRQRLMCDQDHDCGQAVWTGAWPGTAECHEYGWVLFLADGEEFPNLNRLYAGTRWDPGACRHRREHDPVDDLAYLSWHAQRGFPVQPARYTIDGAPVPAADLPAVLVSLARGLAPESRGGKPRPLPEPEP